jgi:hypothetical protein
MDTKQTNKASVGKRTQAAAYNQMLIGDHHQVQQANPKVDNFFNGLPGTGARASLLPSHDGERINQQAYADDMA